MDELKIKTKFSKTIIRMILNKVIKKKLGITPNITIDDLEVSIPEKDDSVHIQLSVDAIIPKNELFHLINKYI